MTLHDPPNLRETWPSEALELCNHCPICEGVLRELLHARLADRTFFAAPGEWTMWRCVECRSGYLDPRPTPDSIHRAYEVYFTHSEQSENSTGSALARLRNAIGNDYRNSRYGAQLEPVVPFIGRLAAKLLSRHRNQIDCEYRFLPKAVAGHRLLDVGSGNGAFLRKARELGWEACGVEPDPAARRFSDEHGFDVRPSLEAWADEAGSFHHATASHVIEHVHEPGKLLDEIRFMLNSGGSLFIQTPNIDAPTHRQFGANWRGLEPPRHLVLFSKLGLEGLLLSRDYRIRQWASDRTAFGFLVAQSARIAEGRDPYSGVSKAKPPVAPDNDTPEMSPDHQEEFLTVIAEAM